MLRGALGRPSPRWALAALPVLLVVSVLAWQLNRGPIGADFLRGGIEKRLESQIKGGDARVGRVGLVWFPEARSIGLRIDGISLVDARGRDVLRARRVEGALAVDALAGLTLAPGRVTARDFYAAVSVSPQGRWELGLDATGEPGRPTKLDQLFADLTGKERMGRPASWLRQLDLSHGSLRVRQVGGTVDWTGAVERLGFSKVDGKLRADVDLRLADPSGREAVLDGSARAEVGLREAFLEGRIENLAPARVFPSVGPTRPLSALDAVVQGRGTLAYSFETGVRSADVSFEAGAGSVRFGSARQRFDSAEVEAGYDPRRGAVLLRTFRIAAEKTRLDLNGAMRLVPEDRSERRPARLEYDLSGPVVVATLAADGAPQTLTDVRAVGRYTPEQRKLEIDRGRAVLAGAPITASGTVTRDRRGQVGAELTAAIQGSVGVEPIFAFWPESLGQEARTWLKAGMLGGRFSNARFTMKAAPGVLQRDILDDDALRLDFDFVETGLRFSTELPAVEQGRGKATLKGNSFLLTLDAGRMEGLALSEGTIEIPYFEPGGRDAVFKVRARGPASGVLDILDRPALRLLADNGFDRKRVTGVADVKLEIVRPMLMAVPIEDYRFAYEATLTDAGLSRAALGFDLERGTMRVVGDHQGLRVTGPARVGPYSGGVEFAMRFEGDADQTVRVDGRLDADIMGGRRGAASPFEGEFRVNDGAGSGRVRSGVLDGRVTWAEAGGERFTLEGQADSRALRALDVPFTAKTPDRFPVELVMARQADGVWRGPLQADALSGQVGWIEAAEPRLLFAAELTPAEAEAIGVSQIPFFAQTRRVAVDARLGEGAGRADVRVDDVTAEFAWSRAADGVLERRVSAALTPSLLQAFGLPGSFRPDRAPTASATWRETAQGAAGSGDVAGATFQFRMLRDAAGKRLLASGALDRAALDRLGAPDDLALTGLALLALDARLGQDDARGRLDVDLGGAGLVLLDGAWRKPAGRPARLAVDFSREGDGALRLTRVAGQGPDFALDGTGALGTDGKLVFADFRQFELGGLIDASMSLRRAPNDQLMSVVLRGASLDARRFLDRAAGRPAAAGAQGSGGSARPMRFDVDLDAVRLTEKAAFRDLKAVGVWGDAASRRAEISARTSNGAVVRARLWPLAGATSLSLETADAGELARTLFGLETLKGGRAVVSGRLVSGGADVNVEMTDVRLVRAPTMAQILTLGSLQGLADTLNGEGVLFNRVIAPVQLRGSRLVVGEARATGSALGLTTTGVADLRAATLDFEGTLAPAYALNSAVGHVPIVGQLLVSRKGEGVVGLGYSARGSFERPQVMVNPLSLMTPGILRRIFESTPPSTEDAPARRPASSTARRSGARGAP